MENDIPISLSAWHALGNTLFYNGQEVFFVDEGEGEPLICIHGFPTASWDWTWIWSGLTARYRVIAPDMMGFGFTAKPGKYEYSLHDQATLHEELIASLGIDRAHFLCHDYGDSVGQELLARAAESSLSFNIHSMCFLNGGIIPGKHRPRLLQRILLSPFGPLVGRLMSERKFNRSFAAIFGPATQPSASELHAFWSLIEHNQGRRIVHKLMRYIPERTRFCERWVGALQETHIPLRFINGSFDPVSGRHMREAYQRLVPNPDTVSLEGIGHYPQVEAPKETLDAVLAFLESI